MIIAIYVPCPDKKSAIELSDLLLQKKLIACANAINIESAYWWEGNIEREGEVLLIMKSIPEHWDQIREIAEQAHPYDVPCIARFDMTVNDKYEKWVREETG